MSVFKEGGGGRKGETNRGLGKSGETGYGREGLDVHSNEILNDRL